MKKVTSLLFSLFFVSAFIFTSCDDLEELVPDPDVDEDEYAAVLEMTEGGSSQNASVFISDLESTATEFEVLVKFKSSDTKMRRLYMTEDLLGAGAERFELSLAGLDKKNDGSIDVESKQGDSIVYVISFPVSSTITEGTVVYSLWTTSGRGDYRDANKNFAVGVGTLTVNYGGTNPATALKSFSAKMLAAPLDDGSSETFISLLDGEQYQIDQGEEYAAFWDFGYYYGAAGVSSGQEASLSSASAYEAAFGFVPVTQIAGTSDLNRAFFSTSTMTSAQFDDASNSSALNSITASTDETINNLSVDDIVEFVDNYGKKGLIRITKIEGTYNEGDFIEIDIKVQP